MSRGEKLLESITDRRPLLTYLADGPAHKRDIIDDKQVSRSTVDRALSDLMESQLVYKTNDGYETTNKGTIALHQVENTLCTLDTIDQGTRLIECLPDTVEFPTTLFREGDIHLAQLPGHADLVERHIMRVKNCERIVGMSFVDNRSEYNEAVIERVLEGELEIELAFEESMADHLLTKYEGIVDDIVSLDSVQLWSVDNLNLIFFIYYGPDNDWVHLSAVGPHGNYRGHTESCSPIVVDWAESQFERIVASGVRFEELV